MSLQRDQAALERGRRFLFILGVLAVGIGAAHAYDAMRKGESPWPALVAVPVMIAALWGWQAVLTRRRPTGALPTEEQVKARGRRALRPLHWISLAVTLAALALGYVVSRMR